MKSTFFTPPTGQKQPGTTSFYYGYIIVLATFILMIVGWGMFYIYGVFFRPLEEEFGWTRAVTSGAFSLSILIAGISGIIAGRVCDRLGPLVVIVFCSVFLSLGYILMLLVQNAWQFYLVYGLLISIGVGGFWAPPVSTVARWFTGRRGFMTGIVSGGVSFGTLILPLLVTQLITIYTWRVTYVIIGAGILVVSMIASRFLKNRPLQIELSREADARKSAASAGSSAGFSFSEALRIRQFWMVCVIYFCFGLVQLTVMVHMVPYASGEGISAISAAGILSVIGGCSLGGRIAMGIIADRVRVRRAAIICLVFMLASVILLQRAGTLAELYVFAVIFGFGYGGLSCMQSLMAAELFGLLSVGAVTAVFSFCFNIGGAIGPVMAGYIFDISGSYQWAFIICLGMVAAALTITLLLNSPKVNSKYKIRNNQ